MTSSLAVGVVDQLRELVAAVGGVDADDHRPRERGGAQPEEVLGGVVEQHADVRRRAVVARASAHSAARRRDSRRELALRVRAVLEVRRDVVTLGVADEQLARGRPEARTAFCGAAGAPAVNTGVESAGRSGRLRQAGVSPAERDAVHRARVSRGSR